MKSQSRLTAMSKSLFLAASILMYSGVSSALLIDVQSLNGSSPLEQGDTFEVALTVSDFKPDPIAAFDLALLFDTSVLQIESISFGSFLGFEPFFETLEAFDITQPGAVSISSLSLLGDAELQLLQPETFTLASLEFLAIGAGDSGFAFDTSNPFSGVVGSGGDALATTYATNGNVAVATPMGEVPEPHAFALLAIGLMSWFGSSNKSRQHKGRLGV